MRERRTLSLMAITLTPCLHPSLYHRDRCSALHCSLYLPTIYRHVWNHAPFSYSLTTLRSKLDLIRRSRFLPKNVLIDFYFKVILPSVTYGLVLRGSCSNADLFDSLERLHCRATRIIFNLPKDMRYRWTFLNKLIGIR